MRQSSQHCQSCRNAGAKTRAGRGRAVAARARHVPPSGGQAVSTRSFRLRKSKRTTGEWYEYESCRSDCRRPPGSRCVSTCARWCPRSRPFPVPTPAIFLEEETPIEDAGVAWREEVSVSGRNCHPGHFPAGARRPGGAQAGRRGGRDGFQSVECAVRVSPARQSQSGSRHGLRDERGAVAGAARKAGASSRAGATPAASRGCRGVPLIAIRRSPRAPCTGHRRTNSHYPCCTATGSGRCNRKRNGCLSVSSRWRRSRDKSRHTRCC